MRVLEDHRLRLEFGDGSAGVVDLAARFPFDGVFAPFNDPAFFRRVRVDSETGTICWPNGVDLDPNVLYSVVTGTPLPGLPAPEDPRP